MVKKISEKNRRGWIKIVEAVMAVILVMGVLLTMYMRNSQSRDLAEQAYRIEKDALDKIASSSTLREAVLDDDNETINNSIQPYVAGNFQFYTRMCDLGKEESCSFNKPEILDQKKNIYAADRIIVAEGEIFNPRKVRLFLWEKG